MAKKSKKTLYGDTIVEAVVAIAIYSIVAVLALGSMSSGLSTAQRNLESTMSRAAIDSQSDALRYYYESYLATKSARKDNAFYGKLWASISPNGITTSPASLDDISENSCEKLIEEDANRSIKDSKTHIFALSGRGALSSTKGLESRGTYVHGFGDAGMIESNYLKYQKIDRANITAAPLYPRIVYLNMDASGDIKEGTWSEAGDTSAMSILNSTGDSDGNRQSRVADRSEGVWIFPKETETGYDFFVRTCWNPVGSKSPSTFTSVVRLYEAAK